MATIEAEAATVVGFTALVLPAARKQVKQKQKKKKMKRTRSDIEFNNTTNVLKTKV